MSTFPRARPLLEAGTRRWMIMARTKQPNHEYCCHDSSASSRQMAYSTNSKASGGLQQRNRKQQQQHKCHYGSPLGWVDGARRRTTLLLHGGLAVGMLDVVSNRMWRMRSYNTNNHSNNNNIIRSRTPTSNNNLDVNNDNNNALTKTRIQNMRSSELRQELMRRGILPYEPREERRRRWISLLLNHHSSSSSPVGHDPPHDSLTRTRIRNMRVSEVRDELMRRGILPDEPKQERRDRYLSLLLNHMDDSTITPAPATPAASSAAALKQKKKNGAAATSSSSILRFDPEQTYILHSQGIRNNNNNADSGTGIGITVTTTDNNNSTVVGMACHYLRGDRSPEEAQASALALALRWSMRRLGLRHVRWVMMRPSAAAGGEDGWWLWRQLMTGSSSVPNNNNNNISSESSLHPMLYYQIISLRDELQEIGSFDWESYSASAGGETCQELALQALQTRETWTWSADADENKNENNNTSQQQQHLLDKAIWMDPMGRDYADKFRLETVVATADANEFKPKPSNQVVYDISAEEEQYYRKWNDEEPAASDKTAQILEHAEKSTTVSKQTTSAHIDPTGLFRLNFDGGSRGNPGPAGAGMVLYDPMGEEIWHSSKYLNVCTNNQAEYRAILLGLEHARHLGIRRIHCHGDSELIIRQLMGEYKVKSKALLELYAATKTIMTDFDEVKLTHINRHANIRADALASRAINEGQDSDPQAKVFD